MYSSMQTEMCHTMHANLTRLKHPQRTAPAIATATSHQPWHRHQPSPQPPATSHGTGTAKVPQILPTEYSQQPHAQAYSQPQPPHTAPAPKIPNIKPNSLPNKVRTPPRRRCLGKYHHHPKVEFGKKPGFGRVRGHKLAKVSAIRAENSN